MSRQFNEAVIMTAKGSTGVGQPVPCKNYRFALVSFATDGGGDANLTVKFQGAISDGTTIGQTPAFGSSKSVTNMWDYIEVIDREDGTVIDGDVGFTPSGDDYRIFQVIHL